MTARRLRTALCNMLLCAAFVACASSSRHPHPEPLDPCGLFFHAWTGSTAGTEWVLVHEEAEGVYRLTDWIGNGIRFQLANGREIQVLDDGQGAAGSGSFADADRGALDWTNWGMSFQSRFWRAPRTHAEFQAVSSSAVECDPDIEGDWAVVAKEISPATGRVLRQWEQSARIVLRDHAVRLEWGEGAFDQGLFVDATHFAIQVWCNGPTRGRYSTPAECSTSRKQDLMGRATVDSSNHITLDLFTQSTAEVGAQIQRQYRYILTRVAP